MLIIIGRFVGMELYRKDQSLFIVDITRYMLEWRRIMCFFYSSWFFCEVV